MAEMIEQFRDETDAATDVNWQADIALREAELEARETAVSRRANRVPPSREAQEWLAGLGASSSGTEATIMVLDEASEVHGWSVTEGGTDEQED